MTQERYEQVVALFQQAAELSPEACETFLAQVCPVNDGLRQEVDAMLAADRLASKFLENTPDDLAAALLSSEDDLLTNTHRLADFKILSRLGAGGMGVVYLAEDTRLGRKAALKLLPKNFARDPAWLSRFEQEARLVSALNHPNIVTVYGISHEGLIHLLATEFVEGRTLREEIARGPMDVRAAIAIVAQVADALSAAHAAGIIHRDVKPENIMVRLDGLVKVLDFGLAKSFHDECASGAAPAGRQARTEGVVLGTVRYMSPEQARGAKLDPRTDLFSLGVVLYEMIVGRPPFRGETVRDEIAEILKGEPAALPSDGRDDRSELERIVRKSLRNEKADRYESAKGLASDLRNLKQRMDLQAEWENSILPQSRGIAPRLGSDKVPFRGLLPFEEANSLLFFGRDQETAQIVAKLTEDPFLAIVGDSGSGKSSLVKAGLIPALRSGRLGIRSGGAELWRICVARPGGLFSELAEALTQLDSESNEAARASSVSEARQVMATGNEGLRSAIAGLRKSQSARVLIVIDQFEELFTSGRTKDEQLRYIDTLLTAVLPAPENRVHLVITLRADFYSHCWIHPELPQRIAKNQFAVQRMQRAQLRETIEKPLALAGVRPEPGLVETLLNEVGHEAGNLALLEHALGQLWEGRTAGVITNAAYEDLGRIKGSLRHYADRTYEAFDKVTERPIARKIFVQLTQLGEGYQDTRRRSTKSELLLAAGSAPEAEVILDKLVSARLITTGAEQQMQKDIVEVAHEALIREWPLLRTWLDEGRQELRIQRTILREADEWERVGREPEALLKGARLAHAEEWLARHSGELPEHANEFVQTGIRVRDKEAQRAREWQHEQIAQEKRQREEAEARAAGARRSALRTRWLSATCVVFMFGALGVGWHTQRQHAITDSRQFAVQAHQNLEVDPTSSLSLAITAVRHFATEEAEVELYAAVSLPQPRVIFHDAGAVSTAAFSLDGKRVVTAGEDHTARVWDAESGRLLVTLAGHEEKINTAVFSPNGKWVVTASDDHTARVWDTASGRSLTILTGHKNKINVAAFSPDGKRVLTASDDHTARVWDTNSWHSLTLLIGHKDAVLDASFSPDGKRVATASEDYTARIWDAESGHTLATLVAHRATVNATMFSPDGKRVLTASDDHTVRVWDADNGHLVATLVGHLFGVEAAVFSPDGKRVATASVDGTARVWDAESGRPLSILKGHHDLLNSVTFSPDGKRVVTASDDHTARVWDADSGRGLATFRHQAPVNTIVFSRDGKHVLTASDDQTARLWDLESAGALATLTGHHNVVRTAVFSPDGKHIATTSDDRTVAVWETETGRRLFTLSDDLGIVNAVAFSPDGKRVVTATQGHTARVWDAEDGRSLLTFAGHLGAVIDVCFSPDGKRVVTASADGTARVWEADDGHVVATLVGHRGGAHSAVFSPDGRLVVTTSTDGAARVWEIENAQLLATLMGHEGDVNSAAFSPDGRRVVTASADGTARVWQAQNGHVVTTLKGHQGDVHSAAFSLDGERVVTASEDHTARLWDAESGRVLAVFTGHQGSVSSAALSPDGKRVVTASEDHTARLWDAESGRVLAVFTGHQGPVSSAAFSPDGKRVVTASEDHTARVYIVDLADLLNWAQHKMPLDAYPQR